MYYVFNWVLLHQEHELFSFPTLCHSHLYFIQMHRVLFVTWVRRTRLSWPSNVNPSVSVSQKVLRSVQVGVEWSVSCVTLTQSTTVCSICYDMVNIVLIRAPITYESVILGVDDSLTGFPTISRALSTFMLCLALQMTVQHQISVFSFLHCCTFCLPRISQCKMVHEDNTGDKCWDRAKGSVVSNMWDLSRDE